jgi:hypothetical protein
MAGWDGGDEVRYTPLGKLAREHRINVVTFRAMRTSFHSRACKYEGRGFSLALPSLDLDKLVEIAQTRRVCMPCLGFDRERLCITGLSDGTTRVDTLTGRITTSLAHGSALAFLSPHTERELREARARSKNQVAFEAENKEDNNDDNDDDDDQDLLGEDEADQAVVHRQRDPPSGKLFDYESPSNMLRHNLAFVKRTLRRPTFEYRNGLAGMALYTPGMDFTQVGGGTLASRSFPPFTPLLPLRSRGLL